MAAQDRDIMLFCHFQALGIRGKIPGHNQCRGFKGEKAVKDHQPLRRGEPLNKADLHIAHELKPHGFKVVKIAGKLQPGPCHILHGQVDGFIVCGQKGRLQVKFPHQGGQRDAVCVGHPDASLTFIIRKEIQGYYTNLPGNINRKIKKSEFVKKVLAFFFEIWYIIQACKGGFMQVVIRIGGARNGEM